MEIERRANAFAGELLREGIPLHSAMIVSGEEIAFERYFGCHEKEELHRLFSVSKSLISLGIGCLEEERKLSLTDPILHYFEEYAPRESRPRLERMTIEDMLRMETCYQATTYKAHLDRPWLPSFFETEPHHEPGMIFNYDTSATHTLCALIERLSGKDVMTYLRERFLSAIGFSQDAYFIRNEFGEPIGGSGLMARTGDLARLAILLLHQGQWRGRQLLPADYLRRATSFQVPTIMQNGREERQGYGYQIWRLTHGGYGCYGLGGQLAACYPEQGLALVTTADTMGIPGGTQMIYDSFYRNFMDDVAVGAQDVEYGAESCDGAWAAAPGAEDRVGARPAGTWPAGRRTFRCAPGSAWEGIAFSEDAVSFLRGGREYSLAVSPTGPARGTFPLTSAPCLTRARYLDENTLYLRTELLSEEMASFELLAAFRDGRVLCRMKNTEEFGYHEFSGWIEGELVSGF